MQEPPNILAFRQWLAEQGATLHPAVSFDSNSSGFSVRTREELQPDTIVVSTPFSLAITTEAARHALEDMLGKGMKTKAAVQPLSERELICMYVSMHWILGETRAPSNFRHFPYLNTLPSPSKLRTPLHFTESELEAFKGTNLYGATLDRKRQWNEEWRRCKDIVSAADETWAEQFAWDMYLTAATYLSSRAFPSSVLSQSPTLSSTPATYPVILPGIDALNHSRAQPVSWLVTYPDPVEASPSSAGPAISIILHTAQDAGSELFNNYGPKPNAELILGYGFSLPENPDDTIVLQLGGRAKKWEVGRRAQGVDGVWEEVLAAVRGPSGAAGSVRDEDESDWQDEMETADILREMTQTLVDRLPPYPPTCRMRDEIGCMLEHYLEGQRAILDGILQFAAEKERTAIVMARDNGVVIVEDDLEDEDRPETQ